MTMCWFLQIEFLLLSMGITGYHASDIRDSATPFVIAYVFKKIIWIKKYFFHSIKMFKCLLILIYSLYMLYYVNDAVLHYRVCYY